MAAGAALEELRVKSFCKGFETLRANRTLGKKTKRK
jgi:hypothetical protein